MNSYEYALTSKLGGMERKGAKARSPIADSKRQLNFVFGKTTFIVNRNNFL